MAPSLADADAVSEVLYRLGDSHDALAGFPDGEGVSASDAVEGPWPHIVVQPSGGGDMRGGAGGSIATGVALEFIGPADLSIGKAELWQRAMRVIEFLYAIPDQPHPPGRPVISDVRGEHPTEQPLASGQYRVLATVVVVISPPQG